MKKIVSLVIVFLFMFNLLPSLFASQVGTVDVNSFDEFSIEQVQKTFSNTLTQETKSDNQNQEEALFVLSSDVACTTQTLSYTELSSSSNVFLSRETGDVLNYLYQYKLFEKNNLSEGIAEYKINLNSYIAIVLVDVYGVVSNCI